MAVRNLCVKHQSFLYPLDTKAKSAPLFSSRALPRLTSHPLQIWKIMGQMNTLWGPRVYVPLRISPWLTEAHERIISQTISHLVLVVLLALLQGDLHSGLSPARWHFYYYGCAHARDTGGEEKATRVGIFFSIHGVYSNVEDEEYCHQ